MIDLMAAVLAGEFSILFPIRALILGALADDADDVTRMLMAEYANECKRDEKLKDIADTLTTPRSHSTPSAGILDRVQPTRDADHTDAKQGKQVSIFVHLSCLIPSNLFEVPFSSVSLYSFLLLHSFTHIYSTYHSRFFTN